jgi:hypothetical protein
MARVRWLSGRQLKRRYVLTFFQKLPPCLVGRAAIEPNWSILTRFAIQRLGFAVVHNAAGVAPFACDRPQL